MLLSMTGFGRGEVLCPDGSKLSIQISSVNRKQLEMRFSLPPELVALEVTGRKLVAAVISRGSLQIRCTLTAGLYSSAVKINTALLDSLIRECGAARVRANLSREVNVEELIKTPGIIAASAGDGDSNESVAGCFEQALKMALDDFSNMRRIEGEILKNDLAGRLQKLEAWHSELAAMTAEYPQIAKERIMNRLADENIPVATDDPALMRELLFYVDKGDVTEELTRLSSHFQQFRTFLEASEPVGRNMDFLAQEIFREITTLGNKAAVSGASPLVVAFKAEMEKIREQIQNIE